MDYEWKIYAHDLRNAVDRLNKLLDIAALAPEEVNLELTGSSAQGHVVIYSVDLSYVARLL